MELSVDGTHGAKEQLLLNILLFSHSVTCAHNPINKDLYGGGGLVSALSFWFL